MFLPEYGLLCFRHFLTSKLTLAREAIIPQGAQGAQVRVTCNSNTMSHVAGEFKTNWVRSGLLIE
jgi:hypothetical protein